jgi:hypothetical protein
MKSSLQSGVEFVHWRSDFRKAGAQWINQSNEMNIVLFSFARSTIPSYLTRVQIAALLHQHLPATASSSPAPAQKLQWPERQFLSVGNDADACVWNLKGTLLSVFHMSTAQESTL